MDVQRGARAWSQLLLAPRPPLAEPTGARAIPGAPKGLPPALVDQFATLAHDHGVPGAQLAVHAGGELGAIQAGETEYGTGLRVTRDTPFPIGSVTKSFTATAAMILVADGDLALDAPLGEHLSELDSMGTDLTLEQVLSHTAGLPAGPDSEEIVSPSLARYVADHCRDDGLVVPPGTGFSYSNIGYVLVGRLVEAITGMSWREALESILLRPLRIRAAYLGTPGPGVRAATGHSVNAMTGRTRPVHQSLAAAEAPAGALAVSATDLVALGLLQLEPGRPDLLPVSLARRMRQPVARAEPFGLADGWGLGLAVFRGDTTGHRGRPHAEWVGHDGNADGTSCHLRVDPVGRQIVAFTSNANTGTAMWADLVTVLGDAGVPVPPAPAPSVGPALRVPPRACVGRYVNGAVEYVVVARGDRLHLSVDGDALAALTIGEDLYFSVLDPASGRRAIGGRFVWDGRTAEADAIYVGGRLARRCSPVGRVRREVVASRH